MKNLILAAALSLGTLTAFAQDTEAENAQNAATEATVQDNFTEVSVSDLPEAIPAAVTKSYPTAKIQKAYVNESKQYKLEVALEDGSTVTLFVDENGNGIDMGQ
jgi:hypothetical protein